MAFMNLKTTIRRAAFTLIELLVVVAIVTLLIAIMLPSLARAREQSKQTVCANNMRQIGIGVACYVTDFSGWLPPATNEIHNFGDTGAPANFLSYAIESLPNSATRKVFSCPAAVGNWDDNRFWNHAPTASSDTTYMPNGAAMARPVTQIPQDVIILHEQSLHSSTVWQRPQNEATWSGVIIWNASARNEKFYPWHFYSTAEHYCNQHFAGGNLVYLDGHAEYRKYKVLRTSDYGLTPDDPWTPTNGFYPYTWAAR